MYIESIYHKRIISRAR